MQTVSPSKVVTAQEVIEEPLPLGVQDVSLPGFRGGLADENFILRKGTSELWDVGRSTPLSWSGAVCGWCWSRAVRSLRLPVILGSRRRRCVGGCVRRRSIRECVMA